MIDVAGSQLGPEGESYLRCRANQPWPNIEKQAQSCMRMYIHLSSMVYNTIPDLPTNFPKLIIVITIINFLYNTHRFFCRFLLDDCVLCEEMGEGVLGKIDRGQLLPDGSPRSGHRLLIQHHLSPVQLL